MGKLKDISTPKRNWSKEEKLKAVNRVLINHETAEDVRKDFAVRSLDTSLAQCCSRANSGV